MNFYKNIVITIDLDWSWPLIQI